MHTVFRLGKPKGRNISEVIGIDGRIRLEWILGKLLRGCGLNLPGWG
jgi:hypothetical protein